MPEPASPHPLPESIALDARRVVRILLIGVAVLALAHLALTVIAPWAGLPPERLRNLRRFVDLGGEANLPTWFATLCLAACSALLALIAADASRRADSLRRHWWGLALLLLFLSADEAALIHDGLVGPALNNWIGRGSGIWHYGWTKAYLPLLALIGAYYLPFLLRLPRRTATGLLLAAAVFLAGAVGLELIESWMVDAGRADVKLLQLFEETCEMIGVVLAIRALLNHIANENVALLPRVRAGAD